MGDIQLSLYERRGALEVEIIRAKGLLMKSGAKTLPGMALLRTTSQKPKFSSKEPIYSAFQLI